MEFCRIGLIVLALMAGTSLYGQDARWIQGASEHFQVYTDTNEAKAQRLLTDLEMRALAFQDVFGPLRPRQFPIQVFLLKAREDFVPLMPRVPATDGDLPPEKNGYLLAGPDRIFIVAKDKSPDDIANDVGHGLGHALMDHQVMWRPFWLSEAAGEYVRRIGRSPDTKPIAGKDAYSVDDLLTIVRSAKYQDSDPGGAFRVQSYRLLRVLIEENPGALKAFMKALETPDGNKAGLAVDVQALSTKFDSYSETPLKAPSNATSVQVSVMDPATVALRRGDLYLAANMTSDANRYYNANSDEARAARAIITRFSRTPGEALLSLARAAQELPTFALVQYHFGALVAATPKGAQDQVVALEKAVKLLPNFGRAYAELARVYALTGKSEQAIPLVQRAIALEPEFADHFYEILSEAYFSLQRYPEALEALTVADSLPHPDRKTVEAYMNKVSVLKLKIENARREVDARRLNEIRRDVESKARATEPAAVPKPVIPVREGLINYEISASAPLEVASPVFPEYLESLRRDSKTGRIVLRLEVGQDGKVKSAVATASQLPEMNTTTIEAAKKWVFTLPQRPRANSINVTLTFVFALQ